MILGWSPLKIVTFSAVLYPRRPLLVGVLKCRTQFWKKTTQGSFQQSLVEIGTVVSEEKIFLNFIPPFFATMTKK
jgi:hypothetical protein